jgi:formate hydrogenlyase transcriptional activator
MLARSSAPTGQNPDRSSWIAARTPAQPERCRVAAADVTERLGREAHRAADTHSQLGVQRLIADLAARLVGIEPAGIGDAIVVSLGQIAEVLRLDKVILWRKAANEARFNASHYWIKHSQPSVPEPSDLASIPFIASRLAAGEATWFTRLDQLPAVDRESCERHGVRSAAFVSVPLAEAMEERAFLAFCSTTTEHEWHFVTIEQLRLVSALLAQALARKSGQDAAPRTGAALPVSDRRDDLQAENLYLRREIREHVGLGTIIGRSPAIQRVLEQVNQVAATDSTALLLGETGTGKELLAMHLHEQSARRGRVMVRVNCSAIPSTLIESELFGREKGAFTGALARQIGRFELADHSTIFLDEIGDLPAEVQVKLLRVLEERQIERLGSPKGIHVDVRIVAATHRNLEQRILDGSFREDLFYRLNVFPIHVPPLRERVDDIPLLVWRFVVEFSKAFGKRIETIPRDNMAALQRYSWPGNIRELRNVVERAMIVATGSRLTIALPTPSLPAGTRSVKLVDIEKEHIRGIVESVGWRIRGAGGAADVLGLRPTTLETRMAKLGLSRPKQS